MRKSEQGSSSDPVNPARQHWLWGLHAVCAVLSNPKRRVHRIMATGNGLRRLDKVADAPDIEILDSRALSALLPTGAVHQGVGVLTDPLQWETLEAVIDSGNGPLLVLDQVSDPRNVGAVFRSAAAFGASGVVMQSRHAPPLSGTLAKAAAGGIEHTPAVRVTNIARSVEALNEDGWTTLALGAKRGLPITQLAHSGSRHAIVLGSEGRGIRPLVARSCGYAAHIPMQDSGISSLNVSVAAAIALHCLFCRAG